MNCPPLDCDLAGEAPAALRDGMAAKKFDQIRLALVSSGEADIARPREAGTRIAKSASQSLRSRFDNSVQNRL